MGDLFRASDPFTAQQVAGRTALELLDLGAQQIREGPTLGAQPEVKAALLDLLGDVYGGLGKTEQALAHTEEALELRLELFGPHHADTLASRVHRLRLERRAGRPALEAARELLPLLEQSLGPNALMLAEGLAELAMAEAEAGSIEAAELAVGRAIRIEENQPSLDVKRLAGVLGTQSAISSRAGDMEEAAAQARRAVELYRQLDATNPAVANLLSGLSGYLLNLGRVEEARQALLEAETLLLERVGPRHLLTLSNSFRLAYLTIHLGDPAGALRRMDADLPIAEAVLSPGSYWIGFGRLQRATALVDLGRAVEAVPEAERARDGIVAAMGEDAQLSIDATCRLASFLKEAGRLSPAREELVRVISRLEAQSQSGLSLLPMALAELAEVERRLGELEPAAAAIAKSLTLQAELWPEGHIDMVQSLVISAEILAELRRTTRARAELERALEMAARVEGMSPLLAERLEQLKRALAEPL